MTFYRDFLGFEPVRSVSRGGAYMSRLTGVEDVDVEIHILENRGKDLLELLCFHDATENASPYPPLVRAGRVHIALTVDNLESLYQRGTELGFDFRTPSIHSPDGVLVCF